MRRDPDPLRRGRRATELITLYQQRAAELARLRRVSIDEAHRTLGLNYKDIADRLGISKGRITQIRSTAPEAERAFFGVGPVSVGIPRRYGLEEGRERAFFDAVDLTSQTAIQNLMEKLSLASSPLAIEPDRADVPAGDSVIICGPKSAPVARTLLDADPVLDFEQADGHWWITDQRSATKFDSPYRRPVPSNSDVGYFARHLTDTRVVVHIAGITSVGSLGVVHWLQANLSNLFRDFENTSISGAVACDFDDDYTITGSKLIAGPYPW
ncbi:nitrogen fixation protein NifE [Nocardia nova]|uniref:Nitrogen fixation protein NifE n=1 Tax=Nocardia nova TaxID=37330 RepID=A0A2T2ZE23_9NOCA|nr:nitrogen fixation protein NifE [Nocardia nova]